MNNGQLKWHKSSYGGSEGGACIEVGRAPERDRAVHVRDSKDPEGGTLTFTPDAWTAFAESLKRN